MGIQWHRVTPADKSARGIDKSTCIILSMLLWLEYILRLEYTLRLDSECALDWHNLVFVAGTFGGKDCEVGLQGFSRAGEDAGGIVVGHGFDKVRHQAVVAATMTAGLGLRILGRDLLRLAR